MDFCSPDNFPMTDAQQGIWYASQARHSFRLYATGQALYLRGDIDQPKLLRAIERALLECEVLNCSFIEVEGVPSFGYQSSKAQITLCDLSFQPESDDLAWQSMEQITNQELGPNSLHQHTHRLYVLDEHEVIWFSCIHHIAFDAYAYHLLHHRAGEHYKALLREETVAHCSFTNLRTLYEDDLAYRQSSQYADDHDYWTNRCVRMPAPTFLGGPAQGMAVDSIQVEVAISAELSLILNTFYQRSGIALSDTLLGVFASYFSLCLGGSRELLFGLPSMGRLDTFGAQAAVTRSNILPLLLELPEDASFQDVCAVVARNRRELLSHQRYRGEWIGRSIGRIGDTMPLYGIELNILPCFSTIDFAGLNATARHIVTGPVRDLNIHLELGPDLRPCNLRLLANASRHSQEALQLHAHRLLYWMAQLVEAPTVPLQELPLVTPTELALIAKWNDTAHKLSAQGILELFEVQARAAPQQLAVLDDASRLTYAELERRSRQVANALNYHLRGAKGKVIGVALERSVEMEVILLAILRAGAVILPLSMELPELRLLNMLEQAGVSLIISSLACRNNLPARYPQLDIKSLNRIAQTQGKAILPIVAEQCVDAPAYILFTSGSSGEPKGVMVGHLALANRLQWMQAVYHLQPTDRVLQKTPATFDVSMWEFFWPLISGATLVMARPGGHTDPVYLLNCIERHNITTLHFVPSMLALFLDALERRPGPLPLRRVFASGEVLSPKLVQRYRGLLAAPLHNLYGPTEAAIDVTYHSFDLAKKEAHVPIGRPIWNTQIHILNEHGRTAPIGIEGELYIEGICLADGYIGQPALTAERFVLGADGKRLYRTGDLARWRLDGEIDYLGRLDQQLKIHGQRVELEEIDAVLCKHSQVHHACANMVEGNITAYIVARGSEPDVKELLELCSEYLPVYMLPQRWLFLTALPLSRNGKLDRKALPAPPNTHCEDNSVPSNLIEQRLCEYFADVLQLPSVKPRSNFFELGGNSLSAVDAAARINAGLGWKISIANIFAHPTPKALSGHGQGDALNMLDTTLQLRPGPQAPLARLPTLFCIHPAGGIAWCYCGLARFLKTPCEIVGLQAQGLTPDSRITQSMDELAEEYANRILAHQPKGPYWLIGWSVGGMIAHSVAVHLERQGSKVELLAMMDAYPSDLWRRFAFETLNAREEESMALAALLFIAGIALPFGGLPSLIVPKGEVLERSQTIGLLRAHSNALASLENQALDRLIDVVINSRRLIGSSSHGIYHGDLLFFTAAAPRAENWLDLDAWRPYIRGRIHNIDIACDHPGMARTEALREIASHLDAAFTQFAKHSDVNSLTLKGKKILEGDSK
ncbi:non-ribosomal peptide synthetase [Serratia sp. BW106]|uniref:non-ribosomal peptide synthetase n=1 Tax=Serratia TaxID=613 RepID=UPI000BFFE466|nr:non-ribosomal peptide synthetase [Serratia sp. BW106]